MNTPTNPTPAQRTLENLNEVRFEISRLNRTYGETIFNPAATAALDAEIRKLEEKAGR